MCAVAQQAEIAIMDSLTHNSLIWHVARSAVAARTKSHRLMTLYPNNVKR